jgi:hypothetical protein
MTLLATGSEVPYTCVELLQNSRLFQLHFEIDFWLAQEAEQYVQFVVGGKPARLACSGTSGSGQTVWSCFPLTCGLGVSVDSAPA